MKKLLLMTALLAGCSNAPVAEEPACDNDSTHPDYTIEEIMDFGEYNLPWCWTVSKIEGGTRFEDNEEDNYVELVRGELPVVEGTDQVQLEVDGGVFTFSTNNIAHRDVTMILESLTH